MSNTVDRIADYILIAAQLMAVAGWLLFEVAGARGTFVTPSDKSQLPGLSPTVLRAGQSVPVSCLNGTLRIEVAGPKLIVATCGNAKTSPPMENQSD